MKKSSLQERCRALFLAFLSLSLGAGAQGRIKWGPSFSLPPLGDGRANPGVARAYAGEDRGCVLLAGGTHFPDRPLAQGGKKVCHDIIYLLETGAEKPVWKIAGRLPEPMGEGASISTPRGILCVGGIAGRGGERLTARTFLMRWDPSRGKPILSHLPDFPYPLRMPAIAGHGNRVYVAGGNPYPAKSDVWQLDLASSDPVWEPLPPLPEGTDQPVAAVQRLSGRESALFLFGGMKREGAQFAQKGGWSLKLFPTPGTRWLPLPGIPARLPPHAAERTMIGASALSVGDQILFFGGANRRVWDGQVRSSLTLEGEALLRYRRDYFTRSPPAFRFGNSVLAYAPVTGKWSDWGVHPFPGRCGAVLLLLKDGRILLTNGEIAPGIRTPEGSFGVLESLPE